MECSDSNDTQDNNSDVPSRLLCREASTLSDKLIALLGYALEDYRCALTHKLGLSSEGSLSDVLYKWCQVPGSTVFVLRGVLIDLGRRDLAQRLVYEMQMMSLYVVVEETDLNTNDIQRQFYTVSTQCDVSLATALDNFLHGNLSNYRIVGPEDWVSWSTPAHELKGKQLTLRHVPSKTDKALYGCNTNDNDDATYVKEVVYKENLNQPIKGMSELAGPHTIGVSNDIDNLIENTSVKRPHTMPTFFNILPGESTDQLHMIDDLKHAAVSPAPSSESVTNNMAAMTYSFFSQSTDSLVSMSMTGQGGTVHLGMSPSISSIDYEFSMDPSTHVKIPIRKKTEMRPYNEPFSADANDEHGMAMRSEPRKEQNIDEEMPAIAVSKVPVNVPDISIFQQNFSENNFGTPFQTGQNQLSRPVGHNNQQNNLNCIPQNVEGVSHSPLMNNTQQNEILFQNSNKNPVHKFENAKVGSKKVCETMDYTTEECAHPEHDDIVSGDFTMSSSLDIACGCNGDSDHCPNSNIYTSFSEMITPLPEYEENPNECADKWNENSSVMVSFSESDERNLESRGQLSGKPVQKNDDVSHLKAFNGKYLAQQEQKLKMMQYSSDVAVEKEESYGRSYTSSDFTMHSSSTKQSPFVHTPPPQLGSSQESLPPTYLDVTSMHGHDFHPWATSHAFYPANFHHHGTVLQSHHHAIAHTTCPQHSYSQHIPGSVPARSLPVHSTDFMNASAVKSIGIQTPPVRRHCPVQFPPSGAISSVSEPPLRYLTNCIENTHEKGVYLTPVNNNRNCELAGHPSSPSYTRQPQRTDSPGVVFDDDGGYSYIEPRHIQRGRAHHSNLQVPNRPLPTPPRALYRSPLMSLEDQTAKIQGWCPNETDSTIERTMKDFKGQNGYFIVWKSKLRKRFIITVSHKHELLHFLIEEQRLDPDTDRVLYYLYKGGFSSDSLLELVNHYISCGVKRRLNDSPIGTKAYACEHIPLRRPLKVKLVKKQRISSGSK